MRIDVWGERCVLKETRRAISVTNIKIFNCVGMNLDIMCSLLTSNCVIGKQKLVKRCGII